MSRPQPTYARSFKTLLAVSARDQGQCFDCLNPTSPTNPTPHNSNPANATPDGTNHPSTGPDRWLAVRINTLSDPLTPSPEDPDSLDNLRTLCRTHFNLHANITPKIRATKTPQDPFERPLDAVLVGVTLSATTREQVKNQAAREHISAEKLYRRLLETALHLYLNPDDALFTSPDAPDALTPSPDPKAIRDLLFPDRFEPDDHPELPADYIPAPRPITLQPVFVPPPTHSPDTAKPFPSPTSSPHIPNRPILGKPDKYGVTKYVPGEVIPYDPNDPTAIDF